MMNTYQICTYDVWVTTDGGYEVNDVFSTGDTVDIQDIDDDPAIIGAISEIRGIPNHTVDKLFDIDGDEFTLYINEKATGKPLMELRRVEGLPHRG